MSIIDEIPTIGAAASLLRARKISATELVRECLARIERYDDAIHAFITLASEQALATAEEADREIAEGRYRGPLHGIPYAVKDVIDVQGLTTTAASRAFASNRAAVSATVIERLAGAGAIVLGKTTTHELTYGGVDPSTPYPPARNPWNIARDPGGSSSGSAAAVAAGFCLAALGTDTGGSVRLPAGLCGIAGLKPTFGRVSRHGVMLNSYSLDHCGPLAWTVGDCALLLQAMAGHDARDVASVDIPVHDFACAIGQDIRGLRIGLVRHFYEQDLPASGPARAAMEAAIAQLRDLGAKIEKVRLRPLQDYAARKATIQLPEIFAEYGEKVRQHPELFGTKLRARIDRGDRVSGVDYLRAQAQRRQMIREMHEAMTSLDALVTCGAYGPAPVLDNVAAQPMRNQPEITVPFSMTGFPALSICIGFAPDGLPLAMQVVGKPFDEASVLRIGDAYERATSWRARRPSLELSTANPLEANA